MAMKQLILISTISLLISGCGDPQPKKCPKTPCNFPKFRTYKLPKASTPKMTKPIRLKDGTAIVVYSEFIELYTNKEYFKNQLTRCNKTLTKSNKIYKNQIK